MSEIILKTGQTPTKEELERASLEFQNALKHGGPVFDDDCPDSKSDTKHGQKMMKKYLCQYEKGIVGAYDLKHAKEELNCEECGRYKLSLKPNVKYLNNACNGPNYCASR